MGEEYKYLKRMIFLVIGIVALTVVYGIYLNMSGSKHVEKMLQAQYASVQVEKVQKREIKAVLDKLDISIKSKWMVDVQAQLDGVVREVPVHKGQRVNAGQVLAVIDNVDLPSQLAQVDGLIAESRANLVRCEQDLRRYTILKEQNAVSIQQYDNAVASYQMAQGELESKLAQKAALTVMKDKSIIYAPQEAEILSLYGHPGSYVRAGEAVALLGDFSQLYFNTILTEDEFRKILPLEGVFSLKIKEELLKERAYPMDWKSHLHENIIEIRVVQVFPAPESEARYRSVDWVIERGGTLLEPTTYQDLKIISNQSRTVVAVPATAIENLFDPHIYIVREDMTLELRDVKIGIRNDAFIEIIDGVDEGELVVISDHMLLEDGKKVRIEDGG